MIIAVCIIVLLICVGCSVSQPEQSVQTCSVLPSPRACATCFVYGDKAYVFGGRDASDNCLSDLWCYDPVTDSWTDLGSTPLTPRLNATACVTNDAVYIGLGYVGGRSNRGYYQDTAYLCDWYRLQPETMTFTPLAPYPNNATDRAISWAYTDKQLYVGYGFRYNYSRDIFRYDIPSDRWDSIDTHVSYMGYPSRSFGGTGAVCQGRMFGGTGYRRYSLNWWAELIPEQGSDARWDKRRDVPSPERTLAACAATDNYIYLAGGLHYGGVNTTGQYLSDVLRYNPAADRWQRVASLPEPLFNHVAFRIGNAVYFGLGETWQNDALRITPNLYCLHE